MALELTESGYLFSCPHCSGSIIVTPEEMACKIFRHAVFKINMQPISPHASQQECEHLKSIESIYGCGKPFQVVNDKAIICDYNL